MNKVTLIAAALIVAVVSYFVYDYGYTVGYDEAFAIKQKEYDSLLAQYQQQATEQAQQLSAAEQQLAQSAVRYEQLRQQYDQVLLDNKTWLEQHSEIRDNVSLHQVTVQRLNFLLGY